jgi:diaminopimelate decarboxylase
MYSPPNISSDLGNSEAVVVRNNRNKTVPFCEQIGGVGVEHLAQTYGSPLFVFDEQKIVDTAHRMKRAFHSRYPNTVFGWSYKTNYLKAICNIFHQEGWIAEVVSEFEYEKAEKAGIAAKDIIYKSQRETCVAVFRGMLTSASAILPAHAP